MILYDTKFLTLKAAKREGLADWIYVSRKNAKNVVVILPLIERRDKKEVLFLKTCRPPLAQEKIADYCVELPAGLVGDEISGETVEEALKKELLEETGHIASCFEIFANKVSSSAGLTSETFVIALAHIIDTEVKAPPVSDNGVILQRVYIDIQDIPNFLKQQEANGAAISSQALAALFYLFAL